MAGIAGQQPTFDLVRRACDSDREAFDRLIERYGPRLESLVHVRMGPKLRAKFEVDDIVQETSLSAFQSIGRFTWQGEESFYRWLTVIALNTIRDHADYLEADKRAGKEVPLGGRDSTGTGNGGVPDAQHVSPLRNMLRHERFQKLERALDGLSPDHREVIILARLERLPLREIAQRMNRTEGAVSMLIVRALQELRKVLKTSGSMRLPDLQLGAAHESPPPMQGPQVSPGVGAGA
jgi:RNA polymerase sigma-70 factor, ECF subfamily